ncbi:hypothetical protein QAD02_016462 [Eretmocerus hayati]|uniref:Uncharacterized protein n=1 Tax=Eretmocerus hayati TaxID=131215 RepID=A0ACC2PB87_9HYME|nr:hypothetical protein QAD02_016462 [Eretmocerus hayati]
MDCAGEVTLTDYTVAVGDIVQPKNISHSSRISRNRVCLYLASKEIVSDLTENHKFLQIGVIEEEFDRLDIKRYAPITSLRADIAKEGYEHILSSRRQTYIDRDNIGKLPEFIKLIHEDTPNYIHPSLGVLKCCICSLGGHIAKHCEKQQTLIDANTDQAQQTGSEEPQVENNKKEGSAATVENPQSAYDQTVIPTENKEKGDRSAHAHANATHGFEPTRSADRHSPAAATSKQSNSPIMARLRIQTPSLPVKRAMSTSS